MKRKRLFWSLVAVIVLACGQAGELETPEVARLSTPEQVEPTETPAATPLGLSSAEDPTETPMVEATATQPPTETPIPEEVAAEPTEALAAVPAAPMARAQDGKVNLRGGPGTDYEIVGELLVGESLEIVGRNADSSWWQISTTEGGVAWVAAEVVAASDVSEAIPVVEAPAPPTAAPTPVPAPVQEATATQVPVVEATATPAPTEEVPASAGPAMIIKAVRYSDEYVELQNTGGEAQDLSGWRLLSERGSQDCPLAGVVGPGEILQVWARSEDAGRGGYNCGFGSNIWNNDEDDPAVLFDAAGTEIDRQ